MDVDGTMDDDDFDEVIGNAPQSPTTGSSQLSTSGQLATSGLSHGFVRTTYGVVNTTHFGPDVDNCRVRWFRLRTWFCDYPSLVQ